MRSRVYAEARARLIAARWVRSDRPRVKVKVDPIVHRSLQFLAAGVVLVALSIVLAPPV